MNNQCKDVILLTPSLTRAGQEKVVYELAKGFKSKSLNVEVVSFYGGPFQILLENLNIPVILLDNRSKFTLIKSFYNLLKSKRKYFFVFHGLGFEKIWLFFSLLNFRMPKSFFVFHNNYPFFTDKKLYFKRSLLRFFLKKINTYIFIKKSILDLALESKIVYEAKKCFVIENGISNLSKIIDEKKLIKLRNNLDLDPSDFVILQVGRFVPQKNQLMSIKAVEKLIEKYSNIKLIFAGEGPLFIECQKYVEINNLKENILFKGNIPNIDQYLNISNLFIMPSFFEGHPISLIEAIMMKVPSVVFDSPGINSFFPKDIDCLHYCNLKNHLSLSKSLLNLFLKISQKDYDYFKLDKCSEWCCDNYSSKKMISMYLNVLNHNT